MNDFEKGKMWKNEEAGTYVHRLETYARVTFGDEGISVNKEIIKKIAERENETDRGPNDLR